MMMIINFLIPWRAIGLLTVKPSKSVPWNRKVTGSQSFTNRRANQFKNEFKIEISKLTVA